MTWGTKLLLVFAAFALLMTTLVYQCMHQNFELVSKDYYSDELRYQDKIDGMNNANRIGSVCISEDEKKVAIQFPREIKGLSLTGHALFYCTHNSANDRKVPLLVNGDGLMVIEKSKLVKARYRVQINWNIGKVAYYTEQNLLLN